MTHETKAANDRNREAIVKDGFTPLNAGKTNVRIALSAYDWSELANFVEGDIANMDENDVSRQMLCICRIIRDKVLRAQVAKHMKEGK